MPDPVAVVTSRSSPTRHIGVVTVGRSDFSILKPLCALLDDASDFTVTLWAGGAHFDPVGGRTIRDVEASGLRIGACVDAGDFDSDPRAITRSMAAQIDGFAAAAEQAIASGMRPDLVLILGDRYEAIAAGLAMVPFGLPVGHISGGSITEGAMDDMFRHALTKLAAVHFCDLPEFARRIQQMGEEPWRIFVTGALGLDGIFLRPLESFSALADHFGLQGLRPGYVLATLHPETMTPAGNRDMARAMVEAMDRCGRQVVFTYPNADQGAGEIIQIIEDAAAHSANNYIVRNFGARWFYSAMAHAGLIVGNSSSGIYEAASFGLPVVDIGNRQKGRFHGANVVHCAATVDAILAAFCEAQAMGASLAGMVNPYGDGKGARRVLAVLRTLDWERVKAPKRFVAPEPDFDLQYVEPV